METSPVIGTSDHGRQLVEIGMVTGVFASEFTHDVSAVDRKHRGKRPGIADLAADAMALAGRAQTTDPGLGPEHLFEPASFDLELPVQVTIGIRDRDGIGKETLEEHRALFHGPLVHEHHGGILGISVHGVGELVDELAIEKSTVVS
jgi:hypothetical protein